MFKKNKDKRIFLAFTLAEILITLGIIGIVAALTIPTIMQSIENSQYKTAYKKAYSVMTQAFNQANTDNLISPRTIWCNPPESYTNWNAFKSQFKIIKECDSTNYIDNCWAGSEQIFASSIAGGVPQQNIGASETFFIDSSGMAWMFHSCFYYLLDTNGLKAPNKYGKDRFLFTFYNNVGVQANGVLTKIWTPNDYNTDADWCPSGDCYYRTWLQN